MARDEKQRKAAATLTPDKQSRAVREIKMSFCVIVGSTGRAKKSKINW